MKGVAFSGKLLDRNCISSLENFNLAYDRFLTIKRNSIGVDSFFLNDLTVDAESIYLQDTAESKSWLKLIRVTRNFLLFQCVDTRKISYVQLSGSFYVNFIDESGMVGSSVTYNHVKFHSRPVCSDSGFGFFDGVKLTVHRSNVGILHFLVDGKIVVCENLVLILNDKWYHTLDVSDSLITFADGDNNIVALSYENPFLPSEHFEYVNLYL